MSKSVSIWKISDTIDLAANVDMYNYICFKVDPDQLIKIESVKIGDFDFVPGQLYDRIGFKNKTSSGFTYYWGEPLIFIGTYDSYLLFNRENFDNRNIEGFKAIYFGYKIMTNINCLFTLNHAGAGRVIEMTKGKTKSKHINN